MFDHLSRKASALLRNCFSFYSNSLIWIKAEERQRLWCCLPDFRYSSLVHQMKVHDSDINRTNSWPHWKFIVLFVWWNAYHESIVLFASSGNPVIANLPFMWKPLWSAICRLETMSKWTNFQARSNWNDFRLGTEHLFSRFRTCKCFQGFTNSNRPL